LCVTLSHQLQCGTQPVQIIDAGDLAQSIIKLIEKQATGFYNAVGPAVPVTMRRLIPECGGATTGSAEIAWLSQEKLAEIGATPEQFPLCIQDKGDWWVFSVDPARAISAGLTLRPLMSTARDTLEWTKTLPAPFQPKSGLDLAAEAQLLKTYGIRS
jgi:2'-hydroxyisoflavone reductase